MGGLALLWIGCREDPWVAERTVTGPEASAWMVAYSDVSTPGGTLFVAPVTLATLDHYDVRLDGTALEPILSRLEVTLWRVPRDHPEGPARLAILDDEGVRYILEIQIRAPVFRDVTEDVGLTAIHDIDGWPVECAEALTGLGFADIDLDGDLDAFVGSIGGASTLYENAGDLDGDGLPDFQDVTAGSGLDGIDRVANISFVDFDNDGDRDLYVGRRGTNRLYRNLREPEGAAVFEDVSREFGLDTREQRTMGSAWGDFDNDGDLDLYVLNHAWCFPSDDKNVDQRNADHLYRNDGHVFTDVTSLLPNDRGAVSRRYGFTGIWVDHDRDGDQDLMVLNDLVVHGGRSVLWANAGPDDDDDDGWRFVNVTVDSGFAPQPDALGKGVNAMGGAVGDLNDDGYPDVAYSNIGPNFLQITALGTDGLVYLPAAGPAGVQRSVLPWAVNSVTWGTHLLDHDNDGDLDLLYVGGELKDGPNPQPHAFFENLGDLAFRDRTWEVGLDSPRHGKASAQLDLDGDGFLEVAVANWADRLEVYRNDLPDMGNDNAWLVVDLEGDGRAVNRDAFGAIVTVVAQDGSRQTCFRDPRPSVSATGDAGCHFGLGGNESLKALTIDWPNGEHQEISVLPGVRRRVRYAYGG